jgi:hypothetical protein
MPRKLQNPSFKYKLPILGGYQNLERDYKDKLAIYNLLINAENLYVAKHGKDCIGLFSLNNNKITQVLHYNVVPNYDGEHKWSEYRQRLKYDIVKKNGLIYRLAGKKLVLLFELGLHIPEEAYDKLMLFIYILKQNLR